MRRTKEDAEQTRLALLEAALEVFSQKGYDATRLEDIAEQAGVTRGAIYHHFGGKLELFSALFEEASTSGTQAVDQAIAEGGSLGDVVRRVLIYRMKLLKDNSRFRRISALYLLKAWSSPELSEFQRLRQAEMIQQRDLIAENFRGALPYGGMRADLDPQVAAEAFLAYQSGLMLLWLLNPDFTDIEANAEALANVFVQGILPSKTA